MSDPKENLRGIVLMLGAMAVFALEDMFLKLAATSLPTGQILFLSGAFGLIFFALVVRRQGARVISPLARHPAVLARNGGEMVGTFAYINALASVDLSTVSAVLQAMPLAVTMGAALFMGEQVGWRRWSAIAIGFAGVLVVIRPGFSGFEPSALWVLVTVAALAVRDLASRAVPPDCSNFQISAWGMGSVAALGAMMMLAGGGYAIPDQAGAVWLAGALVTGTLGYWAITAASRTGEVGVVSPFRYSRLIFAVAIGMAIFGETPDATTFCGAALIIGSGLYSLARQAARKRALFMQD